MTSQVLTGLAVLCVVLLLVVAAPLRRGRPRARADSARPPGPPADAAAREVDYLERLLAGTPPPAPVAYRVGEVVLGTVATRRAAGLNVDVLSRDETATGVPDDLAAVLDNLLRNAHVHGRGRGVAVETSESGGWVELVVKDAGPGVPEQLRAELFRPGARAGARPGSGLGLYISRDLLRAQGGDLELRESPRGATFVARVPAQRQGH